MAVDRMSIEVEQAETALVELGLEPVVVSDALHGVDADDLLGEFAHLCFESEVAVLLDASGGIGEVIAELSDGCRRAGATLELVATEQGPAIRGHGEVYAYCVRDDACDRLAELCGALAMLLPDTISVWLPVGFETDARSMPALVVTEDELEAIMRAIGPGGFNDVFVSPPSPSAPSPLIPPQMVDESPPAASYGSRPLHRGGPSWQHAWQRVADLDPTCPWPAQAERPPGDDFYALTQALCGEPLAQCMTSRNQLQWATLLFRWALATHVGCRWDVLACRFNPGMAAQGMLGLGQLTWAYLVFEALGALPLASRVGMLLDSDWVRPQERSRLTARQRAYFDLGEFMRTGRQGLQVGRVAELVALCAPSAFDDPERVEAALRTHTLQFGDQFTHHPLYWVWPAPIYALARRAGALDRLDPDNPFLANPVGMEDVDMDDPVVRGLLSIEGKLRALEGRSLPPLLDPLPVIVEVRVTALDGDQVVGHTVMPEAGRAEHAVVAKRGDARPKPGELWAFRVEAGQPAAAPRPGSPSPRVQGRTVVPTGSWLERLE